MKHQPRVDPVVTELLGGVKTHAGDDGIAGSLVLALSGVVNSAGPSLGASSKANCLDLVIVAFTEDHDGSYSVRLRN